MEYRDSRDTLVMSRFFDSTSIPSTYYPEDDQFEWRCLLRFLAHPNFPKPIFPNLIELTLPCFENTETMLYASLTLAPSVRIVTVLSNSLISPINTLDASTLSREESLWKSLADQLDSFSGGITSFTISSWQFHGFVPAEVLGVVDNLCQKFTALATLRFPKAFLPPTPFQLPPRLKKLELSIRSLGNPQDEINLPNLTNLQLSVTHIESCNSFLRVFRATDLECLTIHYSSFSLNQSINLQDAFIALLTSANFPHLSSVIVQGDTRGFDQMYDRHPMHLTPPTTFPVTHGVFKPLMACQNMTSITISNCIPTEISDAEFLRMLSAWPNLTALNLASPFQVNSIPQLTWAGLQTALLCCPSLTHLDLPCDARILPHADVAPHPSLSYWNARGSPLELPKEAAKVFQTCFPKLKVLRFFEEFCAIDFDFEVVDPLQAASFVN
ncbi:hypothetical protein BKA70DRAFT_539417 [Coprinopsis sp. MPI-PUGE-AT-0042]|nr:hypothetical protein BKA70DRAFT_539417 [Coprinopsis sp. MPI-PUGE-AT-0042]